MKESVQSESTYNRKQRNLACSDSDFLGLIGEDESRGVEGGCAQHTGEISMEDEGGSLLKGMGTEQGEETKKSM